MPRSLTVWFCNKCGKRHYSHRSAETCEIGHIVEETRVGFSEELARICEPKNISPKERTR